MPMPRGSNLGVVGLDLKYRERKRRAPKATTGTFGGSRPWLRLILSPPGGGPSQPKKKMAHPKLLSLWGGSIWPQCGYNESGPLVTDWGETKLWPPLEPNENSAVAHKFVGLLRFFPERSSRKDCRHQSPNWLVGGAALTRGIELCPEKTFEGKSPCFLSRVPWGGVR